MNRQPNRKAVTQLRSHETNPAGDGVRVIGRKDHARNVAPNSKTPMTERLDCCIVVDFAIRRAS
jgi:hypothetical protein